MVLRVAKYATYLLLGRDVKFVITQYLHQVFLFHRQKLFGLGNVDKVLLNVLVARLNQTCTHELVAK